MKVQLYIDPENRISRVPYYVPTSHVHYVTLDEYEKLRAEVEGLVDDLRIASEVRIKIADKNARLKAEVERLTFDPLAYLDDHGEWMPRHTHLACVERLKAEVERLTNCKSEADRLKAEVERLRKAGDAMAKTLDANEQVYNDCPSVLAESWWIARDGGCP